MGPHDDSAVTQSQKIVNNWEVFDYEACECNDTEVDATRPLNSANDTLKTSSCSDKNNFIKGEESDSDSQAHNNEDETGNLFKLSVLFVRGNPFDSLKHWRMRCVFLDANLRIGSLGRIREVDEEFLYITGKERGVSSRPLSRRGVRLIQVQPKEDGILQESVEATYAGTSEVLKEFSTEDHCSANDLCGFPDDAESKIETNLPKFIASQNAIVDDTRSTNNSITSLADAIRQPDERKTFPSNNCSPGNTEQSMLTLQNMEQTPKLRKDLPEAGQNPGPNQTAANERPGFFTKILRRIIALFQGKKTDVWPGQNSQLQPQTAQQSFV